METNEVFKKVVATIKHLEKQLGDIDETITSCDKFKTEAETKIEEHFAKCMNALAARKEVLLRELGEKIQSQKKSSSSSCKEVQSAIEVRKKMLEAGSLAYSNDVKTAENFWQVITTMPIPTIVQQQIQLELPDSLCKDIQLHGNVKLTEIVKNVQALESKMEPMSCHYSIIDDVSILAGGSAKGLVDGKGALAKFARPRGLCWNLHDNTLFVADAENNAIRKVTLQGEVTTVAKELNRPHGIVMNHKTKEIFVTNQGAHTIVKIDPSGKTSVFAGTDGKRGFQDGKGINSFFSGPNGITIDQNTGNLFISDYNNHAIRKITPQGEVSTLAGSSTAGYNDGSGKNAKFNYPWGIFFDSFDSSLLVCDNSNNKLRHVALTGDVSTVCEVTMPSFVVIANNSILMASCDAGKIYCISREGGTVTALGQQTRESKNIIECTFNNPVGLAVHEPSHSCFIVEYADNTIKQIHFASTK